MKTMAMMLYISNCSPDAGGRQTRISAWLAHLSLCALACLATLATSPLAAQQSTSDSATSDSEDTSSDQTGPVLQNWIPAITIQASEIDLLLEDQRSRQVRPNNGSTSSSENSPASTLFNRNNSTSLDGPATALQPGQFVLHLLPGANSDGSISNSAAFRWSLLGDNTDLPGQLIMRPAHANSYTSLGTSTGNATPLLLQHSDAFTPQLNLGWQLGMQPAQATAANNHYALGADQHRLAGAGNLALASIQCAESVLTSSSYSASGCRFTQVNQQQLLVGLDWSPLPGLNTSASFFESSQSALPGWQQYSIGADNLVAANYGDASISDLLAGSGQQFRGMQIGLQLELLSGNNNIDLSADWSRITDVEIDAPFLSAAADYSPAVGQGSVLQMLGMTDLSVGDSLNSNGHFASSETLDAASLQINWTNGAFSSGLQSIYQQTPLLPGIRGGDDLTTFNLHFTWHTPWHGALSVGANNLLDSTGNSAAELSGDEALNNIYGRIPYVRYKQDL